MERLRRPRPTEPTVANRLKRRFTGGFVASMALALILGVMSVATASRLENNHERVALIEAQRVDLLDIEIRLATLALETDESAAAEERVALGRVLDRVDRRQVDLLVVDPDLAADVVDGPDGESVAFGTAMAAVLTSVEDVVVVITTSGWNPVFIDMEVERAAAAIDAVLAVLIEHSGSAGARVASTARSIEVVGVTIAIVFLVAGVARLFVVARPLIRQMTDDQAAFSEAQRQFADEGTRRELTARLAEGLETVETEQAVLDVVERTLQRIVVDHPAELLLSDSSKAHLHPVVVQQGHDAPACGVTSPWSCPAVRRGTPVTYSDSRSLRACPYLADRGELSAACVPVSFMGDAMGVLHVTGSVGWSPSDLTLDSLEIVASQAAVRLGSIRSFLKAELQANTDVLTGLPNRRAIEHHIREQLIERKTAAVAMADLDRFKRLNDTHGHEAGDRALRLFADVVRESIRDHDWVGRWGGEEFVLYLPELSAIDAAEPLDRIRQNLAAACRRFGGPAFTVSIGVVDVAAASSLDELVSLADASLYTAKEQGRDRVVVGRVGARHETLDAEVVP